MGASMSSGKTCHMRLAPLLPLYGLSLLLSGVSRRAGAPDMHHARGELLISLGDSVLAEQSLQRAIAVARSQTQSYTRSTPPPASRPGGLEIDNQLELNWGLDGKL